MQRIVIDISDKDLDYVKNYDSMSVLSIATINSIIKAIQSGTILENRIYDEDTRQQAEIIKQALPDLKRDIDEIITMKDTFIYHLVMDAIERKSREVEKAMRTD